MSDTYQIVFLKAGDGSPTAQRTVADKIAQATKSAPDQILKQIERAPFIYKKGLPRAKADNIAAALNKLGATTEVRPEGAAAAAPAPQAAAPAKAPPIAGRAAPAAPPASGVGGFEFTGAAPSAPASPSSGFDFGAPASSSSGSIPGYDFESPAPSGGAPQAGGFGGFGFGAPAPAGKSEDFAIEEPSGAFTTAKPAEAAPVAAPAPAPAPGGFGAFNFSTEAATTAPAKRAPVSDVAVSRNLDYAADAPKEAPPAAKPKKKQKEVETTTCPRCQAEVPVANECASCGVVMAKAGESAAAPPRRRGAVAAKQKKSPLLYVAVGAIALVALLAGAFFGGLLNPMRLRMDAGKSTLLTQYAIQVSPPSGRVAEGRITDTAKAQDLQLGFLDQSRSIDDEIKRLSALASVAEFEQGEKALESVVGEYVRHPGNLVLEEIRKVVAPYYPVQGAGLTVGGATYMFQEAVELTGSQGNDRVVAILSDAQIRERLKVGREKVIAAEAQRLINERAQSTNVSFTDRFDAGLGERWQKPQGSAVAASGGRLRIIGQPVATAQAPRLVTGEPDADYSVKVNVSGGGGETRGGLVVITPQGFLVLAKTRRGNSEVVVMVTEQGEGRAAPAGRDVQIRIEKQGGQYAMSFWNGARGTWAEVDRVTPAWAGQPGRMLGLTAFGGSASFEFDDFTLTLAQ